MSSCLQSRRAKGRKEGEAEQARELREDELDFGSFSRFLSSA